MRFEFWNSHTESSSLYLILSVTIVFTYLENQYFAHIGPFGTEPLIKFGSVEWVHFWHWPEEDLFEQSRVWEPLRPRRAHFKYMYTLIGSKVRERPLRNSALRSSGLGYVCEQLENNVDASHSVCENWSHRELSHRSLSSNIIRGDSERRKF